MDPGTGDQPISQLGPRNSCNPRRFTSPRVLRPVSTKPRQVVKIAILDDYQNVALSIADWSAVAKKADITVFNDHIEHTDALIERLLPFDAICVMRERTPLRRDIIERLPRLRFIVVALIGFFKKSGQGRKRNAARQLTFSALVAKRPIPFSVSPASCGRVAPVCRLAPVGCRRPE